MTGFPPLVRQIIRQRADSYCERCGLKRGVEIHHRRPRGMGGTTRDCTNTASNGLLLCGDCHRWVESNRTHALLEGMLVLQVENPLTSSVKYRGTYVHLDDLGNLTDVAA